MSEYTEQANKFLKDTGTEFNAKFIKNDLYFQDDKETRDIYKITLKREHKKISFKFGQSLNNSNGETKPTAYDILSGLTTSNPENFNEFCSSFGYDEDSKKASKIYKAVVKEWEKVSSLFNEKELEELQEIN